MHHVVIFPLPIQGPVNSMLNLAELIIHASGGKIHVTFLTTEHVHRRLLHHGGGARRFEGYAGFTFRSFSDGLPADHPRGGDKFLEMLAATEDSSRLLLAEMLGTGGGGNDCAPPVSCVIADGLFTFVMDVGEEAGTPVLYFDTISPCALWVYVCLPDLVQAGKVPFEEIDELDGSINVSGIGSLLRRRDFPDFCRAANPFTDFMVKRVEEQAKKFSKAHGIILNTFEALEAPLLSNFRSHFLGHIYILGPLHLHRKQRTPKTETMSNNLFCEDRNCLEWLGQQLPRSVIFCSFGSHMVITKDQLIEFWHGLVNSKTRFLWVKRPGSVVGTDDEWHQQVPQTLLNDVKELGFVASWVSQEQVLAHPSVGGFLTHCGWNSTMESIAAGVPMICWPFHVDQMVNSRFVSEVWRVGLDMKDTCDRVIVENMVRDLMKCRRNELSQEAEQLAKLARQSVSKDGSSYCSLNQLIDDIKTFKL